MEVPALKLTEANLSSSPRSARSAGGSARSGGGGGSARSTRSLDIPISSSPGRLGANVLGGPRLETIHSGDIYNNESPQLPPSPRLQLPPAIPETPRADDLLEWMTTAAATATAQTATAHGSKPRRLSDPPRLMHRTVIANASSNNAAHAANYQLSELLAARRRSAGEVEATAAATNYDRRPSSSNDSTEAFEETTNRLIAEIIHLNSTLEEAERDEFRRRIRSALGVARQRGGSWHSTPRTLAPNSPHAGGGYLDAESLERQLTGSSNNTTTATNTSKKERRKSLTRKIFSLRRSNATATATATTTSSTSNEQIIVHDVSNSFSLEKDIDSIVYHEVLGQGASGSVLRCSLRGFSFAAKQYDTRFLNATELDDLRYKITLFSTLEHENIVQCLGYAHAERDFSLLFCEYLPTTLRAALDNRSEQSRLLMPNELKHCAKSIVTALDYLHSRQPRALLHRDVKSDNVLLSLSTSSRRMRFLSETTGINLARNDDLSCMSLKLGDFDECIELDEEEQEKMDEVLQVDDSSTTGMTTTTTTTNTSSMNNAEVVSSTKDHASSTTLSNHKVVGTPQFMAPELLSSTPSAHAKRSSKKSDIYSFGMYLFELLSCDVPFAKDDVDRFLLPELIVKGLRPSLPMACAASTFVPFIELFENCTQLTPSKRPSAKNILAQLEFMQTVEERRRAAGAPLLQKARSEAQFQGKYAPSLNIKY